MRTRRPLALAVLVLLALAALAACSGDDSSDAGDTAPSGDGTTTTTGIVPLDLEEIPEGRRAYVEKADAICTATAKSLDEKLGEQNPQSEQELEAIIVDQIVPAYRKMMEQLRALPPPEGEADQVAEIYDSWDALFDAAAADPAVVTNPDADVVKEASRRAADYGFQVCGI